MSSTAPARPIRRAAFLVGAPALLAATGLLAFHWTTAYRPDDGTGPSASPRAIGPGPTTPRHADPHTAAAPAGDPNGTDPHGAAQSYVEIALDGGFTELHRQAAQSAIALAIEHGFADDPQRVAEAIQVFLHPSQR